MRVRLIVAWYDFWIGVYYDRRARKVCILPVPCIGVVVELGDVRP